MRLKLDENLSVELVAELAALGHDASSCIDEGIEGTGDEHIARQARGESRVLVTFDLDFSDLRRHAPGTHAGIIVLRLRSQDVVSCSMSLRKVLTQVSEKDIEGNLVIVEEARVRIRRPPPP